MENRIENSHGTEIPRKSRSLDLKSLYKSRTTKEVPTKSLKRKGSAEDGDENRDKKKKSRKEVSLSSLKNVNTSSKKSLDEVYHNGLNSGLHDPEAVKCGSSQILDSSSGFNGVSSLSLGNNVIQIPRRKRGFVGRKKFEGGQVLKLPDQSAGKVVLVDQNHQIAKLNVDDLGTQDELLNVKRKKGLDDFKENIDNELNSAPHADKEVVHTSHSVVSNGDSSLKKSRRNRRKRKDLARDSKIATKEAEPLVDSSTKTCHDSQEDNEENRKNPRKRKDLSRDSKIAAKEAEPLVDSSTKTCHDSQEDNEENRRNRRKRKDLARDSKIAAKEAEPLVDSSTKTCHDSQEDNEENRRSRRKRKDLARGGKSAAKEADPLVDSSTKSCHDLQEDDEENLEENAARMLSSRFDPSCTGFSSNNKASALESANGLSFLLSSGQDFDSRRSKSISGSESPSVDNSGRVLRPRKQHKEKGHSRKRRHFYEVFLGNLDAYWVLNRRIKVFWPLDQSWYYGLVNDYDKEKKLHHVKYDDRDEEWIDLQNERFKLLLLPSEVPGKIERKKSTQRNRSSGERKGNLKPRKEKKKRELTSEDDSCIGSYMDTEPIISWLARSNRRVKSPSCAVKKQKTSGLSLKSPLSDEDVMLHGSLGDGSFRRDKIRTSHNSGRSDVLRQEKPTSQGSTCPRDSKMPIVYFRRRRKTGSVLSHTSKGNHAYVSELGSITSFVPVKEIGDSEEPYDSVRRLDANGPLWYIDDAGLLKLTLPQTEAGKVTFELGVPMHSIINDSFGVEFSLFHAAMLHRYGTVVITWPKVYLEMLFVDNVVGLRFLLFEGCLEQAVAFVFLVLALFHHPIEQGKFLDFQLPVTSIRFKFSCVQLLRKQLVFAVYNFSQVKKSKWKYLDSKVRSHCLLTKKLPLSECTYDSIQALQNGTNQSPFMSLCGRPSSVKGTRRRSRQGINFMGSSRESAFVNISHSTSHSDEHPRKLPPLALSFTAAPTFFLSLHLKLLMEHCVANICFRDPDSVELLGNSGSMLAVDCSSLEDFFNRGSKITHENNLKAPPGNATSDHSFSKPETETALAVCNGGWTKSSQHYQDGVLSVAGSSTGTVVPEKTGTDAVVHHPESDQCSLSPKHLVGKEKSDTDSQSFLNGLTVEIPSFDRFEKPVDGEVQSAQQPTDCSWNMSGSIIPSPNPTAPRSTWHRSRNSSSSFGYLSHGWSDGKADLFHNGFGNGPKKPRTQVSYTLPYGGFDFSSKQRNLQKGIPPKRIRRANEKRLSDVSRGSQRNLEQLSCEANVLINGSDRGWRECGAHIVLELFDHNEWKLAVKISGTTKYSYKAHQFLQAGSTNRYTHAMMWKGGKDWILEFPDRSQWALFREMHEECYNRNIRSALVKNIPIPGVRLIEESDDHGAEISFLRSSMKYFRQTETDVEMALDPSRVLYDMDSDDEQWIMKFQNSSEVDNSSSIEIDEEMFEKTMDMFEKVAYAQQCDQFTYEEIEEFMAVVGPMDVIKTIYEHWRGKRLRKRMPLIRHLQPSAWERYQQEVREWEQAMIKTNTILPNGCHEKGASVEKPPMFAFCLKPRGLEVPNKGSKQRSQKRFSVSGHSSGMLGDQDGFHAIGRRSNGFAFGDEKVVYPGHNYDSLDDSPLSQTSPRVFSPRDATNILISNDGFERNHLHRIHRSKSKKFGRTVSPVEPQMVSPYSHRVVGNRNGVQRWNMGFPDWSSQRYYQTDGPQRHDMGLLDGPDLDEFRLRDASGAAQHAHNIARLKREKAQKLFYRADLAIHKAVVSLMTAEAIKGSSEDSDSEG
ncbi:unnamed protein product [Prunus armeniaca]